MNTFEQIPTRFGVLETYSRLNMELTEETKAMIFGKEFHFRRNHIYINFNFALYGPGLFNKNKFCMNYISKDHNVHIYLSIDNFIDDYMHYFIQQCKYATDRIVTIHISKRDRILVEKVKEVLKDLDNWQLILEKHVLTTPYLFNVDKLTGDRTYLCISYYYKTGVERIKDEFYTKKYE